MQWDDSLNAGFGNSPKDMLYIRQDESGDRPTVEAQMRDKDSLWNEIKRLIALRKQHTALQSWGEIEIVYAEKNAYPLAYIRSDESERLLIILNPSDKSVELRTGYEPKETLYSFGSGLDADKGVFVSGPNTFGIFRI